MSEARHALLKYRGGRGQKSLVGIFKLRLAALRPWDSTSIGSSDEAEQLPHGAAGRARPQVDKLRAAALRPWDRTSIRSSDEAGQLPRGFASRHRPTQQRSTGAGAADGAPGGTGSASIRRIGFRFAKRWGRVGSCEESTVSETSAVIKAPVFFAAHTSPPFLRKTPASANRCSAFTPPDAPPAARRAIHRCPVPPPSSPRGERGNGGTGEPGVLLRRRTARPPSLSRRPPAAPAQCAGANSGRPRSVARPTPKRSRRGNGGPAIKAASLPPGVGAWPRLRAVRPPPGPRGHGGRAVGVALAPASWYRLCVSGAPDGPRTGPWAGSRPGGCLPL